MRIQNLPRPTRFMFWCTAPFFILTLVLLPILSNPVGLTGWIVLGTFEALAIFALVGLYDSRRFDWCWRIVGGIVCFGYVTYFLQMVVCGQWFGDGRRSSSTALNALIGFFYFGYPGFMYATFGLFTWLAKPEVHVGDDEREDADVMERES